MSLHLHIVAGSCRIIIGPMFASKTTKLIHELVTFADVGFKCLYINHFLDQRTTKSFDGTISTHHSQFSHLSNKVDSLKMETLEPIDVEKYDVIGVDEGQFFIDLNKTVRRWVLESNKRVIVASLDGDSNMNVFGQALQLIPISESVIKLDAICTNCLKSEDGPKTTPAYFTGKINNSEKKSQNGNNQICVGGSDIYIALCMTCYKKLTNG